MSILNQTSIVYVPQSYSIDGRTPIVAEVWAADDTDLPAATAFDGYNLCVGSKATCANGDTYGYNGSSWEYQDKSPFSDVYTKTEVNDIVAIIDSDITAIETSNNNQSKYIYALIGQSSLNYLDSSVWSGTTPSGSGYIAQDLPVTIPAGTYAWKMKRDGNTTTTLSIRDASNNVLYTVTRGAGVNDITQTFTISADAAKVSIYVGYNISYSDNMIFKVIS